MANDPAATRAPETVAVYPNSRRLIELTRREAILPIATHRLALQGAIRATPTRSAVGVAAPADGIGVPVV
jgi:hypothetical protein